MTEVGTYRCRALHSNHMAGHVWQEYGSETLRARTPDPNVTEPGDGGRGYYRNISLVSAVGARAVHAQQRARARRSAASRRTATTSSTARPTSTAARSSSSPPATRRRAGPTTRASKAASSSTSHRWRTCSIRRSACRRSPGSTCRRAARGWACALVEDGKEKQVVGLTIVVPEGRELRRRSSTSSTSASSATWCSSASSPTRWTSGSPKQFGDDEAQEDRRRPAQRRPRAAEAARASWSRRCASTRSCSRSTASCTADIENDGHRFGEDLPEADKKALIAFLATL